MTISAIPGSTYFKAALQLLPWNADQKNYLWAANLLYQAATFKDIGEYLGVSALEFSEGSTWQAGLINLVSRAALVALACGTLSLPKSSPNSPGSSEKDLFEGSDQGPASLHPYALEAQKVWGGENVTRFDPADPREKVLFLSAAFGDHNGALSPAKQPNLMKDVLPYFDVKFQVFKHPQEICQAVRQARNMGKVAATIIDMHGSYGFGKLNPDSRWVTDSLLPGMDFLKNGTGWTGPLSDGSQLETLPSSVLPYCFQDGSSDSKIFLLACYGAVKPLLEKAGEISFVPSFAEYLFRGTGKTTIASYGPVSVQSVFKVQKGMLEIQLVDKNSRDWTRTFSAEEMKPAFKMEMISSSLGLVYSAWKGWRALRTGASSMIFAAKVCDYAANKSVKQNSSSRFTFACLRKGSEFLQFTGQKTHKVLDVVSQTAANAFASAFRFRRKILFGKKTQG